MLTLLMWAVFASPANAATTVWYDLPDGWSSDMKALEAFKGNIGLDPEALKSFGGRFEPRSAGGGMNPYAYEWVFNDGKKSGKFVTPSQYGQIRDSLVAGSRSFAGRTTTLSGLSPSHYAAGDRLIQQVAEMEGTAAKKYGNVMRGKLFSLLNKLGHWPHWKTFGTIGLAAGTFDIGWQIGSKLVRLPGMPLADPQAGSGPVVWKADGWPTQVDQGEPLQCGAIPKAPVDGWLTRFKNQSNSLTYCPSQTVVNENDLNNSCIRMMEMPQSPAGTGALWVHAIGPNVNQSGSCKGVGSVSGVVIRTFAPVEIRDVQAGDSPDKVTTFVPPEKSLEEQREVADEVLQSDGMGSLGAIAHNEAGKEGLLGDNDEPIEVEDPHTQEVEVPMPGARESYQDYGTRLALRGLEMVAQPGRLRERVENRPDGVVIRIRPHAGTRVMQGSQVKVTYNPSVSEADEDPEADPDQGATGWSPPAVRSVDFSPISEGLSCNIFPFGLFCWAHETLGGFAGSGECPEFSVDFSVGTFEPSLCVIEPIMPVIRTLFVISFFVGFVMLVGGAANRGGEGGRD